MGAGGRVSLKTGSRPGGSCLAAGLAGLLTLSGCASDRLGDSGAPPMTAAPAGKVTTAPLGSTAVAPPPVEMAGRWYLASPGAGACGMTFGGAPGSAEGPIAPEGGCPGSFFTSRRWVFSQDVLVIRDHTDAPLAQLALTSDGRFEGRATSGESVSLTR